METRVLGIIINLIPLDTFITCIMELGFLSFRLLFQYLTVCVNLNNAKLLSRRP